MNFKKLIQDTHEWFKKCLLIHTYHTQMLLLYGSKRPNGWTINKSAKTLDLSLGYISEAIHIVKLNIQLDLDKCKSREEALKKIKEFELK